MIDPLIDELPINHVRRLAKIIGPNSAAAKALWQHNAKETCYFFRSRRGALVVVRESLLQEIGPLKNVELNKHFTAVSESQYAQCIHCGKSVLNQGLAKLAHLANCTGSGARRNKPREAGLSSPTPTEKEN